MSEQQQQDVFVLLFSGAFCLSCLLRSIPIRPNLMIQIYLFLVFVHHTQHMCVCVRNCCSVLYPPEWFAELSEKTSFTRAADVSQTVIARIDSKQHEICICCWCIHTEAHTASKLSVFVCSSYLRFNCARCSLSPLLLVLIGCNE